MEQPAGKVLVVDDDEDTGSLIEDILTEEGYAVSVCTGGQQALQLLESEKFDVVLTDIKMPEITGMDLLLHVRRLDLDTEVILMTAFASVKTAVEALRGEAFDYLSKPFSLPDLRHAVRQAVRTRPVSNRRRAVRYYRDLSIDRKARRVWIDSSEVRLTRLEFDVLAYLFDHQGYTVPRSDLLVHVWGCKEPDQRSIDTVKSCVSRLRGKLGDDAQNPVYIHNMWGVGYQFGD